MKDHKAKTLKGLDAKCKTENCLDWDSNPGQRSEQVCSPDSTVNRPIRPNPDILRRNFLPRQKYSIVQLNGAPERLAALALPRRGRFLAALPPRWPWNGPSGLRLCEAQGFKTDWKAFIVIIHVLKHWVANTRKQLRVWHQCRLS